MRSVEINNFTVVIWMELLLLEQDIYIEVFKKTFSVDVNKSGLEGGGGGGESTKYMDTFTSPRK